MEQFEYKVGDYVYCYNDNIFRDDICIHKKGNLYQIKMVIIYQIPNVLLSCERNEYFRSYWLSPDNNVTNKNFYHYFLSKQEYRELKLKQLNERV